MRADKSHTQKCAAVALVAMVALTMLSCGHQQQLKLKENEAEKTIIATFDTQDLERVIAICDSLQQAGDISVFHAVSARGKAYVGMNKIKLAEVEYKKALSETPKNETDSFHYYRCAFYLIEEYNVSGNNEGILQLALPMIDELKAWAEKNPSDEILNILKRLTGVVGITQLNLGMKQESRKMLEQYLSYIDMIKNTPQTPRFIYNEVSDLINMIGPVSNAGEYEFAEKLLARMDSLASDLTAMRDSTDELFVDGVLMHDYEAHTIINIGMNRPQEAARSLAKFQTTKLAKTLQGRLNEGVLLLKLKRYDEAADVYTAVGDLFATHNLELSLENMGLYANKFEANYKAGRRDSALAVANFVFEHLNSAIKKQKNSDAAELATVYETQQKDAEIAQQQISLSRQRWMGTLIALVLLTTFFVIYTLHRRKAQKRLAAAHQQLETAHTELQTAYNQLEETTAAKERIESELRIARDIQMSMVPGVFPEYKGLDMYAEMTPAKEVGGDLYGYVMQGDRLYFCVGDVSGKGVPASLFMAQSSRLFRTLAAESMEPADIAFRMNNALSENNDRGMFVTMFIGLLHLETGSLDYCNCGHNPPVIDGQFLDMQYENLPLGLLEDNPFEGETIDDIRGHQLLIYTDGLNEAENQQKDLLGNERLLELMADASSLDSRQVIDMLKETVEQHRSGAEPNDDLTLMCLKLSR